MMSWPCGSHTRPRENRRGSEDYYRLEGGGGGGGGGVFITITVTEEARTTRFRVAPAQASPRRRENLREDPRRHSPAPLWRALCP